MTDKVPMPVSGNPESKGAPDGVSGPPGGRGGKDIDGREGGGESEGGAYPNPYTGKTPEGGGFMGHGGQTKMDYHGGGQAGDTGSAPNAVTGSSGDGETDGSTGVAEDANTVRAASTDDGSVVVEETSGIAVAEARGKIGTDSADDDQQPGSG